MVEFKRQIHTAPNAETADVRGLNWIKTNIGKFVFSVKEFGYLKLTKEWAKLSPHGMAMNSRLYDNQLRLYEEMPICELWGSFWQGDSIPEGYHIVVGSVFIENSEFLDADSQSRRVDHRFLEASNGSGLIIDHCAGQFIRRLSTDLPKGTRLATIVERAPGLTSTFASPQGDNHTFLIAGRAAIKNNLGLRYDTQPRTGD